MNNKELQNVKDLAFVSFQENDNVIMGKTMYNKLNEISYFAWIIGYEIVGNISKKYNITECDLLYDFSTYIANNFIDSEEYQDIKYSGYEMLYKYMKNNLEKEFKEYFKIRI